MFKVIHWIFLCGLACSGFAQPLQLSQPKTNIHMAMVSKDNPQNLILDFRMVNTDIRFTQDGAEPTIKSKRYRKPIKVSKPTIIKAKVFHKDFASSETITATFVDRGKKILSYNISDPNPKYAGEGNKTMFDGQFGDMSYSNRYLGYDKGPIEMVIKPEVNENISTIHFSNLINQGAWIFGPSKISVYDENHNLLVENIFNDTTQKSVSNHRIYTLKFSKNKYSQLKLVIDPLASIPDWHDGRGLPAWFFVDEVWVE